MTGRSLLRSAAGSCSGFVGGGVGVATGGTGAAGIGEGWPGVMGWNGVFNGGITSAFITGVSFSSADELEETGLLGYSFQTVQ
mgnify:CR=1 FL=1